MAKAKVGTEEKESDIVAALNKKYGKGSLILGSKVHENLEVIDSGSLILNRALGTKGYPLGILIEFFGPESSGKSTMTLHAIAEFQKAGKKVALVNAEQSFKGDYAQNLGVDLDKLVIVQPANHEQAYDIMIDMVQSKEFSLIVVDSQTSLIPKSMLEGTMEKATMAVQARINSAGLLKLHALLMQNACTVIMISQTRANIGGYGPMTIPTGGNALKFYADIRLQISKLLEKDDSINRTTVEVIKNKCAVPFGKATFAIEWGKGIDRIQEIIDLSIENGSIIKSGAGWMEIPTTAMFAGETGSTSEMEGNVKIQGDKKMKAFLLDNPTFLSELEAKLK